MRKGIQPLVYSFLELPAGVYLREGLMQRLCKLSEFIKTTKQNISSEYQRMPQKVRDYYQEKRLAKEADLLGAQLREAKEKGDLSQVNDIIKKL